MTKILGSGQRASQGRRTDPPNLFHMAKKKAAATPIPSTPNLADTLTAMGKVYTANPEKAVRGQAFIKLLHAYIGQHFERRLSPEAKKRGVKIEYEATVFGSTKPKDVDVLIVDPINGPLVVVGVRSQMSSIGNNVLTYYEGVVGECISLQDRFPMAVHGYVYLHPFRPIKSGKEDQKIDHKRYARMYDAITERHPGFYRTQRGVYDVFAYMIVDFAKNPPTLRDDLVFGGPIERDLRLESFVSGIVSCFKKRELFIDLFD